MQTLNNAELAFLAVLGHQELTKDVLRVYAQHTFLFSEVFHPHLNLMWNAYVKTLKEYKQEYGLKPRADIVAAALVEAVQSTRKLPDELKTRCDTLLQKFTANDIPEIDDGRRLIKNLVALDANRSIVQRLQANSDLLQVQQSLDAAKRTMSMFGQEEQKQSNRPGVVCHPLRDMRKLATKITRIPTGINWLDDLSSGGSRAGDKWLILGASGGGKSCMSVQIACAQAIMGIDVMWATYEQTVEGDIAERIIANITDTSLDQIRDVGFDNIPENVREKFLTAVGGVDDRITALDMTQHKPDPQDPDDYGGVYSIAKHYYEMKAEGRAPRLIIIDWFGAMMSRVAGALHLNLENCMRFKGTEEMLKLDKFAKDEGVQIIMFHQLDIKNSQARPTHLADSTAAKDMHDLRDYFEMVITLGVRDKNDVCYISNPKARKAGKVVRTLRLIGEKSKFVMEDGWFPNSDGNFYKPSQMDAEMSPDIAAAYTRELT